MSGPGAKAKESAKPSFDEIIQADRTKKRNEALANEIFGSSRRPNASGAGALTSRKSFTGQGASLATRIGVTKQRSSSTTPRSHIEGKWGHDLHHVNNPRAPRIAQLPRTKSASRIERGNRLYSSLQDTIANGSSSQLNVHERPTAEMNIKGIAQEGPFVVVASNFAPGTTAADIEAAMLPVGGEITSCRMISSFPTVMAEMVFVEREGAENVIATFNNQKADGRLLYVYMKQGGPSPVFTRTPSAPTTMTTASAKPVQREDRDLMDVDDARPRGDDADRERRRAEPAHQDGRYGFRDPDRNPRTDNRRGRDSQGLYSDSIYRRDRNYRP